MDQIDELLTRGVENIIPNKENLEKLLRSGKKLNIYNGIDPTSTKIHIGHGVPLRKLQILVDLGHNVTFLIGDFTARVGDTSDKEGERPLLTPEQIETNFQTYKKQAEKFLDFSKVKIVHNSEWLGKLSFAEALVIIRHFSLNDFITRELIKKRLDSGGHIRLDEVIYPMMQGYDSYYLDTDLQIGGTDQTFNMQSGRTLQKDLRNKDSFVLATGFLEGTDGRKMSKSWGNAIWVEDEPSEMFGKVMSLKDDLINQYFTLATNLPLDQIPTVGHPMELKKKLAFQIVSELHSTEVAEKAQEEFEKIFQTQQFNKVDLPLISLPSIAPTGYLSNASLAAGTVPSIIPSISEFKRLNRQGAIKLFDDKNSPVQIKSGIGTKIYPNWAIKLGRQIKKIK